PKTLLRRYAIFFAIFAFAYSLVEAVFVRQAQTRESGKEPPPLGKEKIYIAGIHWTNERILRSHWNAAVVSIAKAIGRENVFVSIQESGSLDDTKGALRSLDSELAHAGISRRIILDNTTHVDDISRTPEPGEKGWIKTSRGKSELRRIPYLANLRNLVMQPMYEMQEKGLRFDKVLFLNDVVFDDMDVRRLLNTRAGNYAAACSLDFAKPPAFYDTFALRDVEGYNKLMKTWPYFRSQKSRREVKASRPVPVKSCWNGIVAMDSEAFYGRSLQFRGVDDSLAEYHIEGSECCLIHADNPFSWKKGVWVNPIVRVGYSGEAYEAMHNSGVSTFRVIYGSWMNRIWRWTSAGMIVMAIEAASQLADPNEEVLGEVEPLQVMLENDLLYTFYRGAFGASYNSNCAEYVGLIADKRPGLSILETGAGTGGTTGHILGRLRHGDSSKASRYYFTDISPGFLAKAADRFVRDASVMEFGTLNLEQDPLEQGFGAESFDLIVCANVLHATKSIQETLEHCKTLLKPNGQLVLSEVTIKRIFCGFIMGPLPGWWLGEDDGRKGGPLLDVPEWDSALQKAGYSGVDLDNGKSLFLLKSLMVTGIPYANSFDCPEPHKSLMVGLSRAIRNENAGVLLATLDIDTLENIDVAASAAAIINVSMAHSSSEGADGEFAARGSTIYIPRVERATSVDKSLQKYEAKGEPEPTSFISCGRPLKLTIQTPGLLDTFRWQEDETYYTPLQSDWIEIEVKAVGLNFKDVLVALGNLNENKLGVDVAGVVTRVGPSVSGLKPSDRVITASCDTFATYYNAGEALRQSWHCLAKFGRFLEIGKADLFANTGLDMKPFLDNKSYIGVNLLDFENNPTPRAVKLWNDVARLIGDGVLMPVHPVQQFTFSGVEKAFRYMQTGKHMGKVVVRVDETDIVPAVPRPPKVGIQENATYIVAGLGGIGREIGRWLAEKGAKHLVFLSRSAASGAGNKAYVEDLRKTYNTNATAFDCNVGNRAALQTVLLNISHLPSMSADDLRITVGPKVHGTWNLHDLLPRDLDFFIMLSSLAGTMGHRGQGNYGCGNIFQDYFASYRRSLGLRAMTIDIGYLLFVGFVAENDEYVDHVKAMGLKVMHNSDLHGLIATAMEGSEAHPPEVMCGLPFNEYEPQWYWMADNRFAGLRNLSNGRSSSSASAVSLKDELSRCSDLGAAVDMITTAMCERLARLMMIPAADVDANKPLSVYGVDSLVAVEVRNWIAKEMLVEISVFDIMANVPMKQLARDLAGKSKVLGHVRKE
ncbi:glycosyltransferase family 69 protein, partial [Pseudocercospora fijiensis CIRAD86]